jgi:3-methyl-2-oxobutanoate hydroxymethyltransferase
VSQAAGGAPPRRVTTRAFAAAKARGEPLVMCTAYDALFARLVDEAGVDAILVGDSLGNVVAGYDTTVPVTLDQMIYHGAAVRRGVSRAMVVVDMPFLTYQVTTERALLNCGRVMQETGCDAVKLEGGSPEIADTLRALGRAGIPGDGATSASRPQSVHVLGGFRVQGRDDAGAARLVDDARRLEDAGAFAVVLELVPGRRGGARDRGRRGAHDRHRRRCPLRRAGAGPARPARASPTRSRPSSCAATPGLAGEVRGAVGRYADEVRAARVPGARARVLTRRATR